jgi:hypothetical protein
MLLNGVSHFYFFSWREELTMKSLNAGGFRRPTQPVSPMTCAAQQKEAL